MKKNQRENNLKMPFNINSKRRILCLMIASFSTLFSCKGKEKTEMPPVPVISAEAISRDVPLVINAIGTVEAYKSILVKTRVGGEITGVHFKEGQDVKKGDLLFTIDVRPYEAELKEIESALARDKAKLKSAEAEADRYADLVNKDYITKQEYDNAVANADSLKATVQADEANVENAKLNLSFCKIKAPISGRLGNLLVHEGNLVKANDDKEIVTLKQICPVYVSFSLPEEKIPDIVNQKEFEKMDVVAILPENPETKFNGKLSFINNSIDKETGMILMKAIFPNEDKKLWDGQFVNIKLVLKTVKNAVLVPSDAIQKDQQGEFVFVVNKDLTVEMRPVTTGQKLNGETTILKGLTPHERVVTDGQFRLYPGAKVEIITKKMQVK